MQMEAGNPRQGLWTYAYESFQDPGSYTFYAEAQDTKGQKARTAEFSIVIQMQ